MIIFTKLRKFFHRESVIEDSTKSINNSKLENSSLKFTNEGDVGCRNKSKSEKAIFNKCSNHEKVKRKSQKVKSIKSKNKGKSSFKSDVFINYCNDTSVSSFLDELIKSDSETSFQPSHLENSNFKSQLLNVTNLDPSERLSKVSKINVKDNVGHIIPPSLKDVGSSDRKSFDLKKVKGKISNKKIEDDSEATTDTENVENEVNDAKPKSSKKKSNPKGAGKRRKHKSKDDTARKTERKTDVETKNESSNENSTTENSLNPEVEPKKIDKRSTKKDIKKKGLQNKKKKRKNEITESTSSINETSTDRNSLNTNETKNQISAFKDLDELNSLNSAELSGGSTEDLSLGYKPSVKLSTNQESDASLGVKETTENTKTDSDEMDNNQLMKLIESSTDSSTKEIGGDIVPVTSKKSEDKSMESDSSINSEKVDISEKKEPKINIITPHESERRNKKIKKTSGKKAKPSEDKSHISKDKENKDPKKEELKTDNGKKSKINGSKDPNIDDLKKDSDTKSKTKIDKDQKKKPSKSKTSGNKNKKNQKTKKKDDSDVDSQLSIESENKPQAKEDKKKNEKRSDKKNDTVEPKKKSQKESKKPKDSDIVDSSTDDIKNQEKVLDTNKDDDLNKDRIIDNKNVAEDGKSKKKKESKSSIDKKNETNITGDAVRSSKFENTQDKLKYKETGTDVQRFFENKGTQISKITFTIEPVEVQITQKDSTLDPQHGTQPISQLKNTSLHNLPISPLNEESKLDIKDNRIKVCDDDDLKNLFVTNMQDLRSINLGSHCRICELIFDSCCNCGCLMDKNRIPVYSTVDCNYESRRHNCNSLKKSRSATICKPKKSCDCNYPTRYSSCSDSLTLSYNCIFGDPLYESGCPQKVLCISR